MLNNQLSFDNDGHWMELHPEKPKNLISLEVGENVVGTFVSRVENTVYDGFVYTIQKEDSELYTMYSTTTLDRMVKQLESGDRIRITRSEDKPMPSPKKPLQIYKVEKWVKEDS